MHFAALLFCVIVGLALSVSSCATRHQTPAAKLTADFSGYGPGTLTAAVTLPDLDPALRSASTLAARITYASSSGIDDSPTEVTAAVFAPRGTPPPDGWPIVALGHPATGIIHACAPSGSPDLLGSSATVQTLLQAGFVVTVSDFQGLGFDSADYHPYLDSTTVGANLIDSVFAARRLVPATSVRWIAVGLGQGGQAAWAADELNENGGRGLELLGAVSLSPAADVTGLADAAVAGTLDTEQKLAMQWYLTALKKEYPDFNLDDYRSGIDGDDWDALSECQRPADPERASIAERITADELRPRSPAAADALRGFLEKTTLPQAPAFAPMLVIYGGDDPLIPAAWTDRALERACKMGDTISIQTGADTGSADTHMPTTLGWVKELEAGHPARDDCPAFLDGIGGPSRPTQ